jgi:hypothetical protein
MNAMIFIESPVEKETDKEKEKEKKGPDKKNGRRRHI